MRAERALTMLRDERRAHEPSDATLEDGPLGGRKVQLVRCSALSGHERWFQDR
jgi:hypothetical protein